MTNTATPQQLAKLDSLHEELDTLRDETLDIVEDTVETLTKSRDLLSAQVAQLTEQLRDTTQERNGARAQRDTLEHMLASVRTTASDLVTQVENEKARVADLIREKSDAEMRMENLWEALGNEADRRDWCSEYDEFAEHHGGPRRLVEIDWSAIIEVKIDMSETIDVSLDSVEFPTGMWVPMRFTVSGTREGRRNACVCESYEAQERAQEDLSNESVPWDDMRVVSQTCDAH